ncbi:MAG: glycoside hydrolase family 92 protein, partial [Deltaproteobacteria bacterium]|nr:glycoside hydrolase family 92 protein [Deltaproteobacteria bacterium]
QMPAGTSQLVVSLAHNRGKSIGGSIQGLGDARMALRGDYDVHPLLHDLLIKKVPETGLISVYADLALDRTPTAVQTFGNGQALPGGVLHEGANLVSWLAFSSPQPWTLNAHVCLSLLSPDLARHHRGKELLGKTFQDVQYEVESAWNSLLGRVRLPTAPTADLVRFYTALYHSMLQPADYTEEGQFWNGALATPAAQTTGGRHFYTDDWCIWDTVHTVHPLLTLLAPELVGDMLQSLVWLSGPEGYLPKCPWHASGDSRVMTGNFTFCVLADAVQKGLTQFDVPAAYAVAEHGAISDSQNYGDAGLCGYLNQGSPPFYVQNGYVPAECDATQGASMTLEHAYSDWCLGVVAQQQGDKAMAADLGQRAHNWRNTWGPHGFPQLRRADGTWKEPFDPKAMVGFTEANAWIYQWTVTHEPLALAIQLGGIPQVLARLDEFFGGGHFDMSNEPDFHAPWLYADYGQPWKASAKVRALVDQYFTIQPNGLPGNDDAGATSAWLVFAAMGLYPVNPGDGTYTLTAPMFERIDFDVGGQTVHVVAPGAAKLPHILSAKWNGKPLKGPRISHSELVGGGWLELELTDGPSAWGSLPWGAQTASP